MPDPITFNYTNENMSALNESLKKEKLGSFSLNPHHNLQDDIFRSTGLYSKSDINTARFSRFSKFGRVLDPYGRLNDCREYLFFTKPDLHICVPYGMDPATDDLYKISGQQSYLESKKRFNNMTLNPQLDENLYFMDLLDKHPEVVKELQYSVNDVKDPFCHLLSFSCSSNLELPTSQASTLDNPSTIFGATYEYLKDAESSDNNPEFSLEFVDDKYLDTYNFFKAYSEYHIARKSGLVTPPSMEYYRWRRLHNVMGIYKFIVAEDAETIIHWSYFWGVYPTTVPRETFSDPSFPDGLTFSVTFKSAFMEDMNPAILYQFNSLMSGVMNNYGLKKENWLKTVKTAEIGTIAGADGNIVNGGYTNMIDGTLPKAALVDGQKLDGDARRKYRLRWYA